MFWDGNWEGGGTGSRHDMMTVALAFWDRTSNDIMAGRRREQQSGSQSRIKSIYIYISNHKQNNHNKYNKCYYYLYLAMPLHMLLFISFLCLPCLPACLAMATTHALPSTRTALHACWTDRRRGGGGQDLPAYSVCLFVHYLTCHATPLDQGPGLSLLSQDDWFACLPYHRHYTPTTHLPACHAACPAQPSPSPYHHYLPPAHLPTTFANLPTPCTYAAWLCCLPIPMPATTSPALL